MEEEEKQNKFQDWLERVKHPYRLVVMNNDTFEEVGCSVIPFMTT